MKIGILTHPLRFNYGGLLQNYALQTVLRRLGHEPLTLDVPHVMKVNKTTFLKDVLKRLYYRYILHLQVYIFKEWRYNRLYPIMMQNLQPFIDTHIKKIEVNDFNALNPNDFDAFIVGSDQVWRRLYMPDIYREYLSFAEGWNVRRISYAASFGTEEWEYSPLETTECRRLLQKFDAVSVREASGVSLCKKHFGVEAVHVVDPTLLLDRDDYCNLFEGKELNSTCKCNRILINNLFKFFVWREVSKSFTRSIIEFIFNPLNLFVGYFTKVLTLWDILPDKPVGVFIGTTFP